MPDRSHRNRPPPDPEAEKPAEPHHIADEPAPEPGESEAGVQQPVTETGLPVEEQVRKEWDSNKDGGLPTLLKTRRR